MRTNIVLNDELVKEAFKYSGDVKTKRELVETALKEYVSNRKRKDLQEIRGKISFRENLTWSNQFFGQFMIDRLCCLRSRAGQFPIITIRSLNYVGLSSEEMF